MIRAYNYGMEAEDFTLHSIATLHNGVHIPRLGLGVWKMNEGKETVDAVTQALEAGYRHIDTAKLYANEASVGKAVRDSTIPRGEIFVTTKLWPTDYTNPMAGFEESLRRLDIEYVDLYLIHWPVPVMPKSIWQTFEKIYEQGLAKSIGVSNYAQSDIEKVLGYANVAPMVNQVEFNPANHSLELLDYCKEKGIVVEAYSPLGRGSLLREKTVIAIAHKYGRSPAQILIRWALQHGTVALPKSSSKERIKENAEVYDFSISDDDMRTLDSLE